MTAKGQAMTGFFAGFYKFEPCEPGKYVYEIDLNAGFGKISKEYREFMEEMGIEIVALWGFWVVLRKKAAEGEFQLYTDVESKVESYTKIRNMFKAVTIIEVLCFALELYGAMMGIKIAFVFMLVIGAILITTMREAMKANQMILKLKEERAEGTEETSKAISQLTAAGLLLNACAMMIPESVSPMIKYTVQIVAIGMMLAGIYRMAASLRRQR